MASRYLRGMTAGLFEQLEAERAAGTVFTLPTPPGDERLLAGILGLATATEVLDRAEAVFGDQLDAAARFFVEELFAP